MQQPVLSQAFLYFDAGGFMHKSYWDFHSVSRGFLSLLYLWTSVVSYKL